MRQFFKTILQVPIGALLKQSVTKVLVKAVTVEPCQPLGSLLDLARMVLFAIFDTECLCEVFDPKLALVVKVELGHSHA